MAQEPSLEQALERLLRARSSVRAFRSDPVTEAQIERILTLAGEAPSWSNTQPYLLATANGAACDAVRADMIAAFGSRAPAGEYATIVEYPSPLKERRRATGYGLYEVLGLPRDDREARVGQFRRNYAFFDAPCVMFLFGHEALGAYAALDAGLYLMALLLAAQSLGLSTCAQAALAGYPDVVHAHFEVPARYKLLCGIALGYAADLPVNRFRPARAPVSALRLQPRTP